MNPNQKAHEISHGRGDRTTNQSWAWLVLEASETWHWDRIEIDRLSQSSKICPRSKQKATLSDFWVADPAGQIHPRLWSRKFFHGTCSERLSEWQDQGIHWVRFQSSAFLEEQTQENELCPLVRPRIDREVDVASNGGLRSTDFRRYCRAAKRKNVAKSDFTLFVSKTTTLSENVGYFRKLNPLKLFLPKEITEFSYPSLSKNGAFLHIFVTLG
jgi:hypothetical protein